MIFRVSLFAFFVLSFRGDLALVCFVWIYCLNTVLKFGNLSLNILISFMYKTRVLMKNYKTVKKYNAVIAGWAN